VSGRRSQARQYAVLALYQWQLTGQEPSDISRHFLDDPTWMGEVDRFLSDAGADPSPVAREAAACDWNLFLHLLHGVPEHVDALDACLRSALDRPVAQVTPVELAVLRLATYELLQSPEVPYRVIINEAVDLAKRFGADEQSHRYVNGVLDRVARDVRELETRSAPPSGAGP
jgi:N utilization substance protein B